MKYTLFTLLTCLTAATALQAQDVYVPYDRDTYHLLDRYQIKYGTSLPEFHTNVRPIGRADAAALGEVTSQNAVSPADQFNAEYLLNDNWNYTDRASNESRRPILKYLYRNQTDLYHLDTKDFTLRVNPVLHLEMGKDSESDEVLYVNTRGVQLEGSLDNRFGFYTFIGENQARFPGYVNDRIERDNVVPHEGWWKPFKETGYDFLTARGYLNYALSRHVEIQLGHDRHFIGDGYRSMVYSDYAPPAFFLKLNTRVWKLHYMNLFQELTPQYERFQIDQLFDKRYMATHRLGVNITDNFNLGLFETVIFARGRGRFELQYLNPIILYRSVEQMIGSEDNVVLGTDFRWNIRNTVQLYGQLMLDEVRIDEIRSGNGWWGNRQSGQIGAKYIDAFGLSNLDLQAEANIIRPYMYQHIDQFRNYQHYNQPLAHPMGANLYEMIGIVRYQPLPRLNLVAKGIYTQYGQDEVLPDDGGIRNWGNNVNLSYTTRALGYGNEIAQGITTNQLFLDLTATYQLKHNLFLDLKGIYRKADAEVPSYGSTSSIGSFAVRWNIPQRTHEF